MWVLKRIYLETVHVCVVTIVYMFWFKFRKGHMKNQQFTCAGLIHYNKILIVTTQKIIPSVRKYYMRIKQF